MTREETTIQSLLGNIEALEETIKALQQEQKSFQSATFQQKYEDIAKAFQFGLAFGFGKKYDEMDRVIDEIKKVITPKTGHWIEEIDDYGKVIGWHCDKCYEDSGFTTDCKWDFCPKCGAMMVEQQVESEG